MGYRCRLGHDSIHHAATSRGGTGGWELWSKERNFGKFLQAQLVYLLAVVRWLWHLFVVGVFLCWFLILFCETIFSWQFEAGQNDVVFCFVFKVVVEVCSTHLNFDQTNTSPFVTF